MRSCPTLGENQADDRAKYVSFSHESVCQYVYIREYSLEIWQWVPKYMTPQPSHTGSRVGSMGTIEERLGIGQIIVDGYTLYMGVYSINYIYFLYITLYYS